jgi:hypothetical protein
MNSRITCRFLHPNVTIRAWGRLHARLAVLGLSVSPMRFYMLIMGQNNQLVFRQAEHRAVYHENVMRQED